MGVHRNYIDIIKLFWDNAPLMEGFKSDHVTLFFAVLDLINRNMWHETEIEYVLLTNRIRLGKKNYLECRRWLVDNHFITLKEGKGDYAKARFNIGSAVLSETTSGTAPNTALHTAPGTAGETASGTATDTHLNKTNKQENFKTEKPKNQQTNAGDGDQLPDYLKKVKSHRGPTPQPPAPDENDVREELIFSAPHTRYAIEQLKLVTDEHGYGSLVDLFITQQLATQSEGTPVFKNLPDTRRHFMNWLGRRAELKAIKSHGETQHNPDPNRPHGKQRGNDLQRTAALAVALAGIGGPFGAGSD